MQLFWKRIIPLARHLREQIPRNDRIDRTRTAIVRPAPTGRAAVCRFGKADCRARCAKPGFSISSPNTEIGRSDSATWPDCSGLRDFGNASWETPHFAALLLDRRTQLRNTERMGRRAGYGRVRIDQCRDDAGSGIRCATRGGLVVA